MRDPERIRKYCQTLAECWEMVPDWRFGQFLCNTLGEVLTELKQKDLFFPEDEELFSALQKVMRKYSDE